MPCRQSDYRQRHRPGLSRARPDAARTHIAQTVPLGRIGRPDDIAGLVTFLASRAGCFRTGTIIALDGGITGWTQLPSDDAGAADSSRSPSSLRIGSHRVPLFTVAKVW
ncbi:SDR family oxidoreductase [Nocardia sp. NPDC005998]|uniref:SDR family oxidoreductase n=1 Tax=Nocardia sp. NPDC005998 TaxID=3156894 RepID=UPI0033A808BC